MPKVSRPKPSPSRSSADLPRLSRIVLHVGDGEAAARFYSQLLGHPGRFVGGGRTYFECGSMILALLDVSLAGAKPRPLPETLSFTVKDVEAVHARAAKLKCLDSSEVHDEPAGEIITRPWGERSFYALDPWGNGLCFLDATTAFTGDRMVED